LGTEILSAIETETTEKATVFLKEEDAVVWQIAERDVSSLLERSHRKEGLGKGGADLFRNSATVQIIKNHYRFLLRQKLFIPGKRCLFAGGRISPLSFAPCPLPLPRQNMDISPDILRMHKFTPIGARSLACPPLPVPHEDYCVHFIRPNKTRLLNHKEFDVLTEDLRSCVDKDIKLNPPEIVYGDLDGTEEGADIKILMLKGHVPIAEVRLSPVDALRAWAKCHNGEVSILKGIDAEKWKEKKHTGELLGVTNLHHITTPDDMNFDWTFSTPYCGSVLDGKTDFTTELPCQTLNQSGIPIHLLTDTSQPIVLYEDCMFFEDDLHDVGDVFFNVKLRVMPKVSRFSTARIPIPMFVSSKIFSNRDMVSIDLFPIYILTFF